MENHTEKIGRLLKINASKERSGKEPDNTVSINGHFDSQGNLLYTSAFGHISYKIFSDSCEFYTYDRPVEVKHKYFRDAVLKRGQQRYNQTVFCNERDKGAKPISIGYL